MPWFLLPWGPAPALAQMSWDNFPWGPALTFAGLVVAVALLAMDERNRRKFATKEDVQKSIERAHRRIDEERDRVTALVGLHTALDDRVGDMEERMARFEERQAQQWERMTEHMTTTAETLKEVSREQKETSKVLHDLAIRIERNNR